MLQGFSTHLPRGECAILLLIIIITLIRLDNACNFKAMPALDQLTYM